MLCTGINLGWQKLNEYYELTDDSPVYAAAVILHPAYTWKRLRSKWKGRPDWTTTAEIFIRALWLKDYASLPIDDEEQETVRSSAREWMEAELDELSEDDACATSGGNEYDN
jgi:hypothetical protein